MVVVVISGELVHWRAAADFPQRAEAAPVDVDLGTGMGDDGVALLADDVVGYRLVGIGPCHQMLPDLSSNPNHSASRRCRLLYIFAQRMFRAV